jgi:hypothetical protein
LAATLSVGVLGGEVNAEFGTQVSSEVLGLTSMLLGIRKYIPLANHPHPDIRPYVSAAAGSFYGSVDGTTLVGTTVETRVGTMGSAGCQVGAGVDVQLGRRLMLGLHGGLNLMMDFNDELGGRKNYSGAEVSVGVSWLFGRGTAGSSSAR